MCETRCVRGHLREQMCGSSTALQTPCSGRCPLGAAASTVCGLSATGFQELLVCQHNYYRDDQ